LTFNSCLIILASLRTSAKDLSAFDPSFGFDISSNYLSNFYYAVSDVGFS
jgi:hypothetical protein